MKENKLSVAIPIFNGAKTISNTLESIVGNENVNIVISDNFSNDGTIEILKSYASRYTNIVINYNSENIGFDANLKKCIQLCNTKYVWLLTDDDIIVAGAFEELSEVLNDNNDYGIIYIDNLYQYSGIDTCKSGNDPNDFFYYSKFRSGGMSSNIINREAWLAINFDAYPKDWPHLVYSIVTLTHKMFYIHKNSLKYEYNPDMAKRWLENVGLFKYLYTLNETFSIMLQHGIYKSSTIKNYKIIISKHISTAIIVNKKLKIFIDYKCIFFILKSSRRYLLKNLVLLLTPSILYDLYKKIYK